MGIKVRKHTRKRKNGVSVVRSHSRLDPNQFEKRKPKRYKKDSVSMGARKLLFEAQSAAARLRGKANPKPVRVKGKRLPDSSTSYTPEHKPTTHTPTTPDHKPTPTIPKKHTTSGVKTKKKVNKHRQAGVNAARRLFGRKTK